VRKAFVCGFDRASGKDFEHWCAWVEDKLLGLQQYFCMDVCACAVLTK
jgi:hypothetical protein